MDTAGTSPDSPASVLGSRPYAPGKHIIIVGAGLAGALLATALARLGYRVSVYERRSDPRAKGYVGGRSINLALSTRGLHALKQLNLADVVMRDAIPMPGRMIHGVDSSTTFQPYGKDDSEAINSVSRGGLNLTLINAAAELPNVSFHFDHRCVDVDLDAPAAVFEDDSQPAHQRTPIRVAADLVIGTDGAFSAVRMRLQKNDRFNFSQDYLEQGYKELHIPPTASGEFAMKERALHIWPHGGSMMIALPNKDKSFTCTLFWPFKGEHSFEILKTPEDVLAFFCKKYPDAVPLMPTLAEDYFRNPTSSLVTVRCWPWQHAGKVVILGDAAHAIVPFFGQGMNCAFEDCSAFIDLLEQHKGDFTRMLPEFQALRKPNADAIADLALINFIEMRDKVKSKAFQWKKKLEHLLHACFPTAFVPLYTMVSFRTIPYAAARARAARQWAIVRAIALAIGFTLVVVLFVVAALARK
jgi:kynurenine 3-monooxygenase